MAYSSEALLLASTLVEKVEFSNYRCQVTLAEELRNSCKLQTAMSEHSRIWTPSKRLPKVSDSP